MSAQREEWSRFICSPDHAGRYLYTGALASYAGAITPDPASLHEFLQRLSRYGDLPLLAQLHYLAQPRVQTFFRDHLFELVRSASHSTAGKVELARGGVRGKILWSPTVRTRTSGKADAGTFIIRRSEKSSNIPENQLLKLFLSEVSSISALTVGEIGTKAVLGTLEQLRRLADRALKHPYLKEVAVEYRATSIMRQRAQRHRNWRYGELAYLQAQLDSVARQNKWLSILQLLQQGWLEPVRDDDLFELYTLVVLLDVIEQELEFGRPIRYGLIRPNRAEVAVFHRALDGVKTGIYFDQSPTLIFSSRSEYKSLIADYNGITGAEHRPDIIACFQLPNGTEQRLLVEVKKSEDDQYKRDSVYKVLAYLRDFRDLWAGAPDQAPKAVLVFPQGVTPKPGVREHKRDLVFLSAGDRRRFADLLQQTLSSA